MPAPNPVEQLAELKARLEVGGKAPWPMAACPVCGAHVLPDLRDRHTAYHLERFEKEGSA